MAINHAEKLKEKFSKFPQIERIAKNRHVPKHIYNATKEHKVIMQSKKRK